MSKNGNVIDLFTRKNMEESRQDVEANDQTANEHGTYRGVLPKDTADKVLQESKQLQARQEQIDELTKQWAEDYIEHSNRLTATMQTLQLVEPDFDPLKHTVFIDEDGHVFTQPNEDQT